MTDETEPLLVHSTCSEHPEEPTVVFCARCACEVESGESTVSVLGSVVHTACVPPAPPCPEDIDPALWADGVKLLPHPPYETAIAFELRLRLYAQLFGPAFERQKAAQKGINT